MTTLVATRADITLLPPSQHSSAPAEIPLDGPEDEESGTDVELINGIRDLQDQYYWSLFFATYRKLIHSFARRSGLNATEAQDVVQETMLSVAKHISEFQYNRKLGCFRSWLLTMTRWRSLDQLRKRGRLVPLPTARGETALDDAGEQDDPGCFEFETLWNEEWKLHLRDAAVARVKRQVDPQKYQIYDLYVNRAWSPENVAAAYRIPVAQVYLAKHRVLELIKQQVRELQTNALWQ